MDIPEAIENTLFDLASSAKYVILNQGLDEISSDNIKVCNFPSSVTIKKNPERLSISYDDRLIKFDRDFNVISNESPRSLN